MSKIGTPKNGSDCISTSLKELFGSSSETSLLDYSQFTNLVDVEALKLVDISYFNFIHIPTLAFFFKYLGALAVSATIIGAFVLKIVMISTPTIATACSLCTVGAYDEINLVEDDAYYPEYAEQNIGYVDYRFDDDYYDVVSGSNIAANTVHLNDVNDELGVLGVADVTLEPEVSQTEYPSCSFEVDGQYYSSGTQVSVASLNEFYVCANYNVGVNNSTWTLSGKEGLYPAVEIAKECSYLANVEVDSELVIKVYNDKTLSVDSCTLEFVR